MCGGEQSAEEDANTSNDNIGNAKERVPAAHDGASTDEDGLGAVVD